MDKIQIHTANPDHLAKWVEFQRENYGERHIYKGKTIPKWEAFSLIENGVVEKLPKINSDYHKRLILTK